MSLRMGMGALAILGVAFMTPAFASPSDQGSQASAPGLAHSILDEISAAMPTCGPKGVADGAISRATDSRCKRTSAGSTPPLRRGVNVVRATSDEDGRVEERIRRSSIPSRLRRVPRRIRLNGVG